MQLQLVRHATLVVRYPSMCLLVDPQLDEVGARAPLPAAADGHARNPTRPLPLCAKELVAAADAVLVTHLHADHFDGAARRLLDGGTPILCQEQDVETLRRWGFRDVRAVRDQISLDELVIRRAPGRHGHGVLARAMGPVSGFVLRCEGEPTLYIAGDSVWFEAMRETLECSRPDVVVLNGGAARLVEGPPVTMTVEEVREAARVAANATVVVVHLEASNACTQTRADLRQLAGEPDLHGRLRVPADGEKLDFAAAPTYRSAVTRPTALA